MHVPPPLQMVQLLAGFQVSQALYAAAKLGIPDELADGPRSTDDIARRLQLDPTATRRLVRSLAAIGVFAAAGDAWSLTPLGRTLVADAPGSMRDLALMWMETHYAPFGRLADAVRTGTPAADLHYGRPFFNWLADEPEQVHRFSRAMANLTDGIKYGAVDTIDLGDATHVVDVGGADGSVLARLLGRHPYARGTVLDLPHVVAEAATTLKAHGLGERLQAVGGDFFTAVPSADAYVLAMILHDWDDDRARTILGHIAAAGTPGASVHALELVLPPGDEPHLAAMIDLTMLGMLTGRERTADELRALVEGAGLRFEGLDPTATPMSVLRARVPGRS